MPILSTFDFKIEIPKSTFDPAYADFEILLGWYNTDGGWYNWLFTDYEEAENIDGEIINYKTAPSKFFSDSAEIRRVVAEDLDYLTWSTIHKIIRSKNIWRIFRTDSGKAPVRVAIVTDSARITRSAGRYNLELTIREKSPTLIN